MDLLGNMVEFYYISNRGGRGKSVNPQLSPSGAYLFQACLKAGGAYLI